ncbi:MAG: hypothetical protein ACK5LO_13640 [Leucobacter sp.]
MTETDFEGTAGRRRRIVMIALAIGFAIALIAVVIALILGGGDSGEDRAQPEQESRESSSEIESQGSNGSGLAEEDMPEVKFDENGMVEMVVTDDPHVAAASAAAVLMSAETTRIQFTEDFRAEALGRVTQPSPDYVGPGDQVLINEISGPITKGDLIPELPQRLADWGYNPGGSAWWLLGDDASFQSFKSFGKTVTSHPVAVLDEAEMDEYTGGANWVGYSDNYVFNMHDGARVGIYWVRVETHVSGDDGYSHRDTTQRLPVALSIFCDPPSEGGICGVDGLMSSYPDSWKASS